jgi:hypothetical protein
MNMKYDSGVKITVRHLLQSWGLALVSVSFISTVAILTEMSLDTGIAAAMIAILLLQMGESFVLTILIGNTVEQNL